MMNGMNESINFDSSYASSFNASSVSLTQRERRITLNFPKRVVGRDDEFGKLISAFNQVNGDGHSGIVFIRGRSGTGKTAIVKQFAKDEADWMLFGRGKYDQFCQANPMQGLVDCLFDVCENLIRYDNRHETKEKITSALGSEENIRIMQSIVPNLGILLGSNQSARDGDTKHNALASQNVKYLIRSFLEALGTTVVLFLDDLQWADQKTLHFLTFLLLEKPTTGILIIGSYRDDEVGEDLQEAIVQLHQAASCPFTDIEIKPLSLERLNEIISAATRAQSLELSEVIYERTNGNVFFAIQLLKDLQRRNILVYDFAACAWKWDIDDVKAKTKISHNVAELLVEKIEELPERCQRTLTTAACLGRHFEVDLLCISEYLFRQGENILDESSWKAALSSSDCQADVYQDLDTLLGEGLISFVGNGSESYEFLHDRIQAASYSLINDTSYCLYRIGKLLLAVYELEQGSREWMLFAAVENLQLGEAHLTEEEKIPLVSLYIEAAQCSAEKSSLVPSTNYLRQAVKLLGDLKWTDGFHIQSLELFEKQANIEYLMGNKNECLDAINEVLNNARCLEEKYEALFVYINMLGNTKQYEKCLDESYSFLKELGESSRRWAPLPRVGAGLTKVKLMVARRSKEDLLKLPAMANKKKIAAMEVYKSISTFLWWHGDLFQLALVSFRIVELTLLYGMHKYSSIGICFTGIVFGYLNVFSESRKWGDLSLAVASLFPGHMRTPFLWSIFILHSSQPFQDCVDAIFEYYQIGLSNGDLEYGMLCGASYSCMFFHCGHPLQTSNAETQYLSHVMQELHQFTTSLQTVLYRQAILILMGISKNEKFEVQSGEAINHPYLIEQAQDLDEVRNAQAIYYLRMQLAYYFRNIPLATKMALKLKAQGNSEWPVFYYPFHLYWRSLVWFEAARVEESSSKRSLYLFRARDEMSRVKSLVKAGFPSCHHLLDILRAEHQASKLRQGSSQTKFEAVMRSFGKAVNSAGRGGFTQNQALACERAALTSLKFGDDDWKQFYIRRAHDLYKEWGALAKVSDLEDQYSSIQWDNLAPSIQPSTNLKGKQRLKSPLEFSKILAQGRSNSVQTNQL